MSSVYLFNSFHFFTHYSTYLFTLLTPIITTNVLNFIVVVLRSSVHLWISCCFHISSRHRKWHSKNQSTHRMLFTQSYAQSHTNMGTHALDLCCTLVWVPTPTFFSICVISQNVASYAPYLVNLESCYSWLTHSRIGSWNNWLLYFRCSLILSRITQDLSELSFSLYIFMSACFISNVKTRFFHTSLNRHSLFTVFTGLILYAYLYFAQHTILLLNTYVVRLMSALLQMGVEIAFLLSSPWIAQSVTDLDVNREKVLLAWVLWFCFFIG